jgi:hypothetical protein
MTLAQPQPLILITRSSGVVKLHFKLSVKAHMTFDRELCAGGQCEVPECFVDSKTLIHSSSSVHLIDERHQQPLADLLHDDLQYEIWQC